MTQSTLAKFAASLTDFVFEFNLASIHSLIIQSYQHIIYYQFIILSFMRSTLFP